MNSKIKLLSWNVYYKHSEGLNISENKPGYFRNELIDFINYNIPDIMCLQESNCFKSSVSYNVDSSVDTNPSDRSTSFKSEECPFKGIKLSAWDDNWVEFISNSERGGNSAIIYWNKKFKRTTDKIFRIDTNHKFDPENIYWIINNKDKSHSLPYIEEDMVGGINGGRPLIGVKLKHINSNRNFIIFCIHLDHNEQNTDRLVKFINIGLDFLNYKKGDRILLLGDFNEFVSLSPKYRIIPIRNGITLYLGDNLPLKTCCDSWTFSIDPYTHYSNMKYKSDLMYDSFNELSVKLGFPKASDHLPLIGQITNYAS